MSRGASIDEYAKDGGQERSDFCVNFYHEPLRN